MAINNLYSKRNSTLIDIYSYEPLQQGLKIQIQYILQDFRSNNNIHEGTMNEFWSVVAEVLLREHKLLELDSSRSGPRYQVVNYFLALRDGDKILDVVELAFRYISKFHLFSDGYHHYNYPPAKAIADLNQRFKENASGYRFESDMIIKISDEALHQEITKPALVFLSEPKMKTANEEYLKAHEHFRYGRNKDCLNDCLKAFESTMKIICTLKGWQFDSQKATATPLIDVLFKNNYLPAHFQTSVNALRSTLESGIPVMRNKYSGHGQGTVQITVDDSLASYCLNLTGSTIKFLLELL